MVYAQKEILLKCAQTAVVILNLLLRSVPANLYVGKITFYGRLLK
jgi:hypothetical protein